MKSLRCNNSKFIAARTLHSFLVFGVGDFTYLRMLRLMSIFKDSTHLKDLRVMTVALLRAFPQVWLCDFRCV